MRHDSVASVNVPSTVLYAIDVVTFLLRSVLELTVAEIDLSAKLSLDTRVEIWEELSDMVAEEPLRCSKRREEEAGTFEISLDDKVGSKEEALELVVF